MKGRELTAKQRLFVDEYMVDKNATAAAIRAGYSARTAHAQGPKMLQIPRIAAEIEKRQAKLEKRIEVNAIRVLGELAAIGFANAQDLFDDDDKLIPIKKLPRHVAAAISSVEVEELFEGRGRGREHVGRVRKIKFWDKRAALVDLGRHLNLFERPVDPEDGQRAAMSYIELARRLAYVFSRAAQEGRPATLQHSS